LGKQDEPAHRPVEPVYHPHKSTIGFIVFLGKVLIYHIFEWLVTTRIGLYQVSRPFVYGQQMVVLVDDVFIGNRHIPVSSRYPATARIYGVTIKSTTACTGMADSTSRSNDASATCRCCLAGNIRARLVLYFSTNTGMPSSRRRLWPIGYSTTT